MSSVRLGLAGNAVPEPARRGTEQRGREADMTITSRGAVATTADQAETAGGAPATAESSVDTAALDAIVGDVADHAATWAMTDATTRRICSRR